MDEPKPPQPPDDDEEQYRPRRQSSWPIGCLVSLLVLGLIFFFVVSVCSRV